MFPRRYPGREPRLSLARKVTKPDIQLSSHAAACSRADSRKCSTRCLCGHSKPPVLWPSTRQSRSPTRMEIATCISSRESCSMTSSAGRPRAHLMSLKRNGRGFHCSARAGGRSRLPSLSRSACGEGSIGGAYETHSGAHWLCLRRMKPPKAACVGNR